VCAASIAEAEVLLRNARRYAARLAGEPVVSATRVVSLHAGDARPIKKGKLSAPVGFGYKGDAHGAHFAVCENSTGRPLGGAPGGEDHGRVRRVSRSWVSPQACPGSVGGCSHTRGADQTRGALP
jgi:hypothetical protein